MQPVLSEQAGKEKKVTTAWGIRQEKVKKGNTFSLAIPTLRFWDESLTHTW